MKRKLDDTKFIGQITSGITRNALALRIIDFVRQQLPAWRDDPDRLSELSEDKLNLQLCKFLDSRARFQFPMVRFDHEEYQCAQRRVDISASPVEGMVLEAKLYTVYDPVLVIEGKRLPAPSTGREKEYVTGNERKSGGIQRFKLGLHGANYDLAAMVGYMQNGSTRDWQKKINSWIAELADKKVADVCAWNFSETLELLDEDVPKGIANYRSVHSRVQGDEIELHHFWIVMNLEN